MIDPIKIGMALLENNKEYICSKCKDKGYIFEGKGKKVHTCLDCLNAGRLNQ